MPGDSDPPGDAAETRHKKGNENEECRACVCDWALSRCGSGGSQRAEGGPPTLQGIFRPVVGSGAQYAIQDSSGNNRSWEMAIVGKESVGGKDAYWLENTMRGLPTGDMVTKSLMVVEGNDMVVSRIIMQMPGRPPMELSGQMAQMLHYQKQHADIRTDAEDLGSDSVTTPAGTFTCEHYRMKDGSGDAWVSEKVAPFGLVKWQGKDSSTVLVKVITDAKDKITGTPQPFNPMMMGQQPQAPEQ